MTCNMSTGPTMVFFMYLKKYIRLNDVISVKSGVNLHIFKVKKIKKQFYYCGLDA